MCLKPMPPGHGRHLPNVEFTPLQNTNPQTASSSLHSMKSLNQNQQHLDAVDAMTPPNVIYLGPISLSLLAKIPLELTM